MGLRNAVWTLIAVAALFAFPAAAPAADEPEAVYAKFHNATLAANFDEVRKYGTAEKGNEMAAIPASERKSILQLMGTVFPKTYSVAGKTIAPDGNRATLRLTAMHSLPGGKPGPVNGTITLVKEKGVWKVDEADWGGQ